MNHVRLIRLFVFVLVLASLLSGFSPAQAAPTGPNAGSQDGMQFNFRHAVIRNDGKSARVSAIVINGGTEEVTGTLNFEIFRDGTLIVSSEVFSFSVSSGRSQSFDWEVIYDFPEGGMYLAIASVCWNSNCISPAKEIQDRRVTPGLELWVQSYQTLCTDQFRFWGDPRWVWYFKENGNWIEFSRGYVPGNHGQWSEWVTLDLSTLAVFPPVGIEVKITGEYPEGGWAPVTDYYYIDANLMDCAPPPPPPYPASISLDVVCPTPGQDSSDLRLSGQVKDQNGNPMSGVEVNLALPNGTVEVTTDENGEYEYLFEGAAGYIGSTIVASVNDLTAEHEITESDFEACVTPPEENGRVIQCQIYAEPDGIFVSPDTETYTVIGSKPGCELQFENYSKAGKDANITALNFGRPIGKVFLPEYITPAGNKGAWLLTFWIKGKILLEDVGLYTKVRLYKAREALTTGGAKAIKIVPEVTWNKLINVDQFRAQPHPGLDKERESVLKHKKTDN